MAEPRLTKAEQAERTRRNLLEAASRLYYERGYAGVSLNDIAEEAGVTKGALYAHFTNKEEFFIELMAIIESSVVDISMFGTGGTPGEEMRAFARAVLDTVEPKMVAIQSDYVSLALRNPRAGDVFAGKVNETLTELGAVVEAALADQPDGHFSGTDLVVLIDCLLQGLMTRHALNPELVTDQLFEDALGLIFSAFITGIHDPDEAIALREQRRQAEHERTDEPTQVEGAPE